MTFPEADVVVRASRVFTGILASTLSDLGEVVTPTQLRVLVLVATRPGINATGVAGQLGVHPSTATRLCDRLVAVGLMARRELASDRRHVELMPTEEGSRLLRQLMQRRRRIVNTILSAMTAAERTDLERCLAAFCDAAGEPDALTL